MPRKFIYGPGLPGYGTAGTDGSAGLTGLAVFFSAYDGNSDTVTIKGKIIANKELFSNDVLIPGYPDRVYQTGDIFIDKNARVFQIDLNEANLYKDTGIFLNTSGFFAEGPPQTLSPGFQRYSNAFETDKFLIDTVYTNTVGDYTQYPSSIYDNMATYFGRVSYIGNDVLGDLNGWYPFEIWTIGNNTTGNDAVALARRGDRNEWHFGNFDDGSVRDASLYLDFNDIYCPSIFADTAATILYYDAATGRITYGLSPSGMTYGGSNSDGAIGYYVSPNTSTISRSADLLWNYSDSTLEITGNIELKESPSQIKFEGTGTQEILTINKSASGTSTLRISSGTPLSSGPYVTGGLQLVTGKGVDYAIGGNHGGDVSIYTGKGGAASSVPSGRGGNVVIKTGDGADTTLDEAGDGGGIIISTGKGGNAPAGPYITGGGGDIDISTGRGGTGGESSRGGDIRIYAGGCTGVSYAMPGSIRLIPGDNNGSAYSGQDAGVFLATNSDGHSLGSVLIAKGSPSFPGIQFAGGHLTNGFYYTSTPRYGIGVVVAGSEQFRFDVSTFHADGNIIAYSSLISDIRLKKNIRDLPPSLDKILALRGISYERKSNGEKHVGYIAQEFENLFPGLIAESEILGEDPSTIYKTIRYTELIPYLSGAIQEQQKYINKLEDRINDQDTKIDLLKKEIESIKNKQ